MYMGGSTSIYLVYQFMYILYIGRDYPPQFIPGSTGSTGIYIIIKKII